MFITTNLYYLVILVKNNFKIANHNHYKMTHILPLPLSFQEPQDNKRAAAALAAKKAAKLRHNVALDRFRDEQDQKNRQEYAHILSRLTALEIEKARAARIASLPPPVKETVEETKPAPAVKCVEDFSTTHYHVPGEYVEKAEPYEQVWFSSSSSSS